MWFIWLSMKEEAVVMGLKWVEHPGRDGRTRTDLWEQKIRPGVVGACGGGQDY